MLFAPKQTPYLIKAHCKGKRLLRPNFDMEEKVREDTNLSGKSHTLLLFVGRKISDELILAAKATARKQADHQKHNTAASLRVTTFFDQKRKK